MEDNERLIKALNNLAEIGEKRREQQEKERKEEAERARRRRELYAQFYGNPARMTFIIPQSSALLDSKETKNQK